MTEASSSPGPGSSAARAIPRGAAATGRGGSPTRATRRGEVLVPDAADAPCQVLDVRDLAELGRRGARERRSRGSSTRRGTRDPRRATSTPRPRSPATGARLRRRVRRMARGARRRRSGWAPARSRCGSPTRSGPASRPGAATRPAPSAWPPRPLEETLRDVLAWEESRPADTPRQCRAHRRRGARAAGSPRRPLSPAPASARSRWRPTDGTGRPRAGSGRSVRRWRRRRGSAGRRPSSPRRPSCSRRRARRPISIVRFWWVMTMSWLESRSSSRSVMSRPRLVSSRAASTSSRT